MKVRIWQKQADLFEVSVLEQTAQPVVLGIEELATEPTDDPIVLVGRGLTAPCIQSFRDLASRVSRTGATLLVCPPFGDRDIGRYFDTPVSVRLVRRTPQATVKVMDRLIADTVGEMLNIRSDQFIETALGAGIVTVDAAGKPTIVRYQSSNRAGAIFISAIQLLSYTAVSNEPDRQALLSAVLGWHKQRASADSKAPPQGGEAAGPEDSTLVPVLLALAAGHAANTNRLGALIRTYLGTTLNSEQLTAALEYLATEGVVDRGATTGSFELSEHGLRQAIEALGLHAYARELREMVIIAEESR